MDRLNDVSFVAAIRAVAWICIILLTVPTIVVVVASFTAQTTLQFPPSEFSIRWYAELWNSSPQIWRAAKESLSIAAATALICVTCGTLAAVAIARSRTKIASILDGIFMSPLVLPAMAFGLAMLLMFSALGISLSSWTLVAGHVIIATPYVIRLVGAAFQQLNPSLVEASISLGASSNFTFFNVTLPLIKRGVVGGGLIAFLTSFDHVPVSLMLADPRSETLPIHLWTILENNLDVRVASVCGVIVGVTLAVAVLFQQPTRPRH
jgi:putative spermidine/putrescine transport system permease protein